MQCDKLAKVERDHLVMQDLPLLEMPPDLAMLSPHHLGVLYVLDRCGFVTILHSMKISAACLAIICILAVHIVEVSLLQYAA